ncbi:hypothetical protein RIF29_10373 [Crotalaria pallida]|uniref:Uncharacterized protein n=1 Tax=Crotalaria pallida TaxID=3830 RepID=A0AAN9FVY0_CROPI
MRRVLWEYQIDATYLMTHSGNVASVWDMVSLMRSGNVMHTLGVVLVYIPSMVCYTFWELMVVQNEVLDQMTVETASAQREQNRVKWSGTAIETTTTMEKGDTPGNGNGGAANRVRAEAVGTTVAYRTMATPVGACPATTVGAFPAVVLRVSLFGWCDDVCALVFLHSFVVYIRIRLKNCFVLL